MVSPAGCWVMGCLLCLGCATCKMALMQCVLQGSLLAGVVETNLWGKRILR